MKYIKLNQIIIWGDTISEVIDKEKFIREAKIIKEEIIPFVADKLLEHRISPETAAMFFAEMTKAILIDIDNKAVEEIIIRNMLDDDTDEI